jgi:ABC-type antimicrobial peptide transport system permease subunit
MALVVYVFATVLMLAAGLRQTLVATGQDDNVIVIRRSSQTEVQSGVDRRQAAIVESLPDIAYGPDGERLISKETVVLISLGKRGTGKPSNVVIRGVTTAGLALRPQVRIVEGRMFKPGSTEIVVGRAIADGFAGTTIGESVRFASRGWTVVGIFDAGRTGFDSEIWGDAEQMLQSFRRVSFSSVIFRLADSDRFDAVKRDLETDPQLTVEAKRESRFYADQSELLAKFISYLGTSISAIFSIGAIIGAMITMYASVASRTAEIGTLRALGFSRAAILAAFLVESLLLGLAGGVAGLVAASAMQALSFSTMNFQTFAEIAFSFTLTPSIVAASLAFALAMGFVGGFLPAARAARMKIVDALRAA